MLHRVGSTLKLYKLKSDWFRNGNSTWPRVCMRDRPKLIKRLVNFHVVVDEHDLIEDKRGAKRDLSSKYRFVMCYHVAVDHTLTMYTLFKSTSNPKCSLTTISRFEDENMIKCWLKLAIFCFCNFHNNIIIKVVQI